MEIFLIVFFIISSPFLVAGLMWLHKRCYEPKSRVAPEEVAPTQGRTKVKVAVMKKKTNNKVAPEQGDATAMPKDTPVPIVPEGTQGKTKEVIKKGINEVPTETHKRAEGVANLLRNVMCKRAKVAPIQTVPGIKKELELASRKSVLLSDSSSGQNMANLPSSSLGSGGSQPALQGDTSFGQGINQPNLRRSNSEMVLLRSGSGLPTLRQNSPLHQNYMVAEDAQSAQGRQ